MGRDRKDIEMNFKATVRLRNGENDKGRTGGAKIK